MTQESLSVSFNNLKWSFSQVCHSKSGEINPVKVGNLVKAYVDKYKHARKHKKGDDLGKAPDTQAEAAKTSDSPRWGRNYRQGQLHPQYSLHIHILCYIILCPRIGRDHTLNIPSAKGQPTFAHSFKMEHFL